MNTQTPQVTPNIQLTTQVTLVIQQKSLYKPGSFI